jgi:hypothetical protein
MMPRLHLSLSLLPLAVVVAAMVHAQVGYLLRFELQRMDLQRAMKQRIREGIPREDLTRFTMTEAEWRALRWVKPEREFRLPNGDMYDVVHIRVADGIVDALCVHDRDETALFAGLEDHIRSRMDGPDPASSGRTRVVRLLVNLFPPAPPLAAAEPQPSDRFFPECVDALHPGWPQRWELPPRRAGDGPPSRTRWPFAMG